MKVFIQGMRRSGTTVAFDILARDPRFDAWYEPFGPAKRGRRGGGSGLQDVELAARNRALRERFAASPGGVSDPAFFNYGAPRDPDLELAATWPTACVDYLRAMLDAAPDSVVKFVRAAEKLHQLREIAPGSKLVHLVRDPRRVAVSQMLSRERAAQLEAERFFGRCGKPGGLWASRALSERLRRRPEHAELGPLRDFERVLLVWRHLFERTHEDGRTLFGDDYQLVRHEDLGTRPRETTERLYRGLGLEAPESVLAYAEAHLRAPGPPPLAGAPEWRSAFARLKMEDEVRAAGYGEALLQEGSADTP
ncbi:MAG: sulfotransferase [Myxococcota bacterium]